MARTQAGADLTERHRQRQLQVRAQALRDYTTVWPVWRGDPDSFALLVGATVPLVERYHSVSSGVAVDYYQAYRMAEGVPGAATPRMALPVNRERVATSLHVTGRVQAARSVMAGFSPQAAMQNALVTTAGAVGRHVLSGGRETLMRSTGADSRSATWERVTGGDPCAFCMMLASRGPVYRGQDTGDFQAHDHCACTVAPHYGGSAHERNQQFRNLWNQHASGAEDPLNAFRRFLADA